MFKKIRLWHLVPSLWGKYMGGNGNSGRFYFLAFYGFSSSHIQMLKLDHKEGWAPKNWCLWNVMLEKTPERPLESKKIKPINSKENQHWISIGLSDAESEVPIFGHLMWRADSFEKKPDAGKDWWQEMGTIEDEMFEWHHWCNGYKFE